MIPLLLTVGPSAIAIFGKGFFQIALLSVALFRAKGRIKPPRKLTPLICTTIFFSLAILSTIFINIDDAFYYYKLSTNSLVAILMASVIRKDSENSFASKYSNTLFIFSILALLGLFLNLITPQNITTEIGLRTYHTNFLTIWISDAGYNSSQTTFSPFNIRLQSYFDEPGTYGVLAVPALAYFTSRKSNVRSILLFSCIVLSESFNAILLSLLVILAIVFNDSHIKRKITLTAISLILIYIFCDVIINLYEIKMGLDEAYANNSSFETRYSEYEYIYRNIADYAFPKPLQNISHLELPNISSSYVRWIFDSGFILFAILLFPFFETLKAAKIGFFKKTPSGLFISALCVSVLISGFQRTSFLDNILFLTIIYYCIESRFTIEQAPRQK